MAKRRPAAGRTSAAASATRVERRRVARQERLLQVATDAFATRGLDGVRLDEIADAVDIARGTLYTHFPTKEALVVAIVRPVLEHAVAALRAIERRSGAAAVEALISIWIDLWRDHGDAMRVFEHSRTMPLGAMEEIHGQLLALVLEVFEGAARQGELRVDDPELAARMIARLAVPLLELCGDGARGEARFRSSMHGLLLRE
jgi:AcrR family transcriptional regulator